MTKEQIYHISMMNSYNLITGKAKVEDVIYSGIGMFVFMPNNDATEDDLDELIRYFEMVDMFEHCADIIVYRKKEFNPDGSYAHKSCRCDLPTIESYPLLMVCGKCKGRIRKS
jgi:hypothetical protein